MRIVGGKQAQDPGLKGNFDAIAIRLSEDPQRGVTSWTLRIDAKTSSGGRQRVGTVKTTPASLGKIPTRLVAAACCPGAIEWIVNVEGPKGAYPADLVIAGCAAPLAKAGAQSITRAHRVSSGAVLLASQIVSLAPLSVPVVVPSSLGAIEGIHATGDGVTRYLQSFDAAGVPADGTEPIISIPVADGGWFYEEYDDDDGGEFYSTGVVWAASTTPEVLTLDAAAKFRVRTQLEV